LVAPVRVFDQFALKLRLRGAGPSLGTPRCAAAGRARIPDSMTAAAPGRRPYT
jgi:hypothetical protein